MNLTDEGRANYSVQLDRRIIPKVGDHQLRHLRAGPIESWVSQLRKQGVGDPTILKTLTVFRSILKRAERDEEIERNPIPLVAKPKQERRREPRPIAPFYVELIRRHMLDPTNRRDRRGRSSLAALGCSRPSRATSPSFASAAAALATTSSCFGEWSPSDWDNWRQRIFRPAAIAVGLPADAIPATSGAASRSLLIFKGLNVLEVAPELGHKPSTCLDIYGRLFEEFEPSLRRPAAEVIREARDAVRSGAVPTGYPAARRDEGEDDGAAAESRE